MDTAPLEFPKKNAHFTIPVSHGVLEVKIESSQHHRQDCVAIVCHPHPLHQGTMDNKVVTSTIKAIADCNIPAVRFNYRGVGQSTGEHGHTVGETEDLLDIAHWLNQQLPNAELILAGFSFGAYIALKGALQLSLKSMLAIAPAIPHHADYTQLAGQVSCPYWVIIGAQDELVPVASVKEWHSCIQSPTRYIEFPDTTHFFHGKLLDLKNTVKLWLNETVGVV